MKDTDREFLKELVRLDVSQTDCSAARKVLETCPDVADTLANPLVTYDEKRGIINKLFPESLHKFMLSTVHGGAVERIGEIFDEYDEILLDKQGSIKAVVRYVTPLTEAQQADLRKFIMDKFVKEDVDIEYKHDPDIIGGFILNAGDLEYDKSYRTSLRLMKDTLQTKATEYVENSAGVNTGSKSDIISVLKTEVRDFDVKSGATETGFITRLGDGIARVYGMNSVMYGELVEFETGVRGIVQNLEEKSVGVVLLGDDHGLTEGSSVIRTGKRAGIGVSDELLGRVVDALGAPIDGLGQIKADDYFPIEREAPGVIERKPVSVPLQTGILAIDSMFPIGRGQRELIIGDRQTGKTSIAVDTIINQKGQDVICIYVAIGQKSSTVAQIVNTLKKYGAMDYSVVVAASASDPAPFQYISPYSGTAIAEYFMSKGKDVLIVYDDLSKHAVAYRAMSLLLHRPPGREAYPGDVFYLHSRLLERSSRLDDEHGGGSLTALPIIETLAGDISAYIPTNVISITDGQIFLESELFNSGLRPAVNYGLSVSRVGGAAQTKAMKKASGNLRIDLAQFKEMEIFTQFSSELDQSTTDLLNHGHMLTELLKQPLYNPLPHYEQVILLYAAQHGFFKDIPLKELREHRTDLMNYIRSYGQDIISEIEEKKVLTDDLAERIEKILTAFEE
ncbi:F0F1 ATP synthase subunit alpha [Ruminococcus flavefaciens]|uniref:F0F1 ATP synthase subunit alpha n=2 Tax=Ruminococcus flavefaciens TaxID=1265 RepID=UPI0026EC46D7|nr:F0F1 ATP synthase subunit alpha [Ruminococcus flavefaciens]MDD7517367.1 F0F1 ATP synthase subunit alpha [Ruminococcus flavefaciens]MDY5690898.1 F0F1 ATP synthase subunit alpha [Ruminococcus flavefaciens]